MCIRVEISQNVPKIKKGCSGSCKNPNCASKRKEITKEEAFVNKRIDEISTSRAINSDLKSEDMLSG